jgi:hypothetical protein
MPHGGAEVSYRSSASLADSQGQVNSQCRASRFRGSVNGAFFKSQYFRPTQPRGTTCQWPGLACQWGKESGGRHVGTPELSALMDSDSELPCRSLTRSWISACVDRLQYWRAPNPGPGPQAECHLLPVSSANWAPGPGRPASDGLRLETLVRSGIR